MNKNTFLASEEMRHHIVGLATKLQHTLLKNIDPFTDNSEGLSCLITSLANFISLSIVDIVDCGDIGKNKAKLDARDELLRNFVQVLLSAAKHQEHLLGK